MKNSVKKVVKTTAILLLALIFAGSPAISPITSKTTIEAEASAKSDKAVKNARKCYYSTRKNLRRYKKVRNGSTSTDYWSKNKLVFSEIKPDKRDFLSIKNTVCEYYYSKSKLVFAFAYQKKGRKVKEYMLIIWAVNVTDTLARIKKCIPMVQERVMDVCQEWQRNYIKKEIIIFSWHMKRMNQSEINSTSDIRI